VTTEATYLLARNGQQHGPYTLEQLRQMSAQGQTQADDLVWTAGMSTWIPLADVVRYAPPTAPPPLENATARGSTPRPPSLHWALLLVLTLVTIGFFGIFWMFVQAWWVKKIDPKPKAIYVLALGLPISFVLGFAAGISDNPSLEFLSNVVSWVAVLVAYFDMRAAIEVRFNMNLSGIMTFFFGLFYLQYHMRKIAHGEHDRASARLLV
jgi:hypothetical protein